MRAIPVALICVALIAAIPSLTQAAAPTPAWALVDMEKLAAGYQAMQDLNQQFQDFRRQQEAQIEQRHKTRVLTDEEQREYLDLVAMAAPTEARAERLAELEELSNQRERSLLDLRENKNRTPEQETEYQYLNPIFEKRMGELVALQNDLQKTVAAKYEELSKVITESVTAAVKAVADERKLSIVLRKEAVLYHVPELDITDVVVAKLNAPPPE